MASLLLILLCAFMGRALGGEPEVNCTAPPSIEHGQAFLDQNGQVVKCVCEPGYVLTGKELIRCIDGKWDDESTSCIQMNGDKRDENYPTDFFEPPVPSQSLFSWESVDDDDNSIDYLEKNPTSDDEIPQIDSIDYLEKNPTSDNEIAQGDDARVHMVLYPRRRARIVTKRGRSGRIQSASELEEEEKKKSDSKKGKSATTIHLTVDESDNADQVQIVALPRGEVTQSDKGEDAIRQMYWYAHHNYYNYPRSSSLVEYRRGYPAVTTLTDSQINWINSLHPELRDQYLRDMYIIRADDATEGARAQAILRGYGNLYDPYYAQYFVRQPLSVITRDPISNYDYSCNQAGSNFVIAPKLPNAHIARYDRRQNPNSPQNHYLTAVYRCNQGFVMYDTRFTELHCSKRNWIGTEPVCIRKY